jgi:hypothetical protein
MIDAILTILLSNIMAIAILLLKEKGLKIEERYSLILIIILLLISMVQGKVWEWILFATGTLVSLIVLALLKIND